MSKKISWIVVLAIAYLLWIWVFKPNPNLEDMPKTSAVSSDTAVQHVEGYSITALEHFEGEFRILSRENYLLGRDAEFSPVDFAVGWGKMADPSIYKQLDISQGGRWYRWYSKSAPPISVKEIETSSSNIHIIPANASIGRQLAQVKADDMVYLSGDLVEIRADDGWVWRSSLSREDTGDGACELLRVDQVVILNENG
ncbi:hypothetical protein [Acinetobacter marinus]|uniref:hypothetical protein n=1 Tax=Acinetobacter marinus TaxID=281375 RepID=UPI000B83B7DE|nr:hypothetical protein [Acinetobacter marinus]